MAEEPAENASNGSVGEKFFRKYFLEGGQNLDKEYEEKLENVPEHLSPEGIFFLKSRKLIGFIIPVIFFWLIWWSLAIKYNLFILFPDHYYISITMIFGALVAGMTPEAGGAVAFPVMTLILKINPSVARDFALMIQSCGMTAAAFTILWMKITLEWHTVVCCSFGAAFGFVFGVEAIDKRLTPSQKKMGFVSIWFSFAIALFILNMEKKRKTFDFIHHFNIWKAGILALTGFVGGICTAISGSGVDVCSFSVITLLFHVTEKVATPTSVVLMAVNTVMGFYWREVMMGTISAESWDYLAVCAPMVVVCAPVGSILSSHFHRQVLAFLIYILENVALIMGFVIVKPDFVLTLVCFSIIFGCFVFFFVLSKLGKCVSEISIPNVTGEPPLENVSLVDVPIIVVADGAPVEIDANLTCL